MTLRRRRRKTIEGWTRWTSLRKAELIQRIARDELTATEAIERYDLSSEELETWARRYASHGERGLMQTRVKVARDEERFL